MKSANIQSEFIDSYFRRLYISGNFNAQKVRPQFGIGRTWAICDYRITNHIFKIKLY